MTENEKNELRQEGFVAGAKWADDTGGLQVRRTVDAEAAARYPTADVQQAPSGRWYAIQPAYQEIASWRCEDEARQLRFPGEVGIRRGDELAVAQLLTRHAQRSVATRSPS